MTYLLLQADARRIPLADGSVDCCVTSPPYWQKRAYGCPAVWGGDDDCLHEWGPAQPAHHPGQVEQSKNVRSGYITGVAAGQARTSGQFCQLCGAWRGELGQEQSPDAFVAHLVSIFAEVYRVLKPTGTCWVNLDSSRAGAGYSNNKATNGRKHDDGGKAHYTPGGDYGETEIVPIPWLFAFAMRAAGWRLYDAITWGKLSPMPESVRRRTTHATETIFMFAKGRGYFYDQAAIAEPAAQPIGVAKLTGQHKQAALTRLDSSTLGSNQGSSTRNAWDWWLVDDEPQGRMFLTSSDPLTEAHYAAWPREIPRRCIAAGSKPGDVVLDPFAGSGRTVSTAVGMGRRAVGVELKTEYAQLASRLIDSDPDVVLRRRLAGEPEPPARELPALPLFALEPAL